MASLWFWRGHEAVAMVSDCGFVAMNLVLQLNQWSRFAWNMKFKLKWQYIFELWIWLGGLWVRCNEDGSMASPDLECLKGCEVVKVSIGRWSWKGKCSLKLLEFLADLCFSILASTWGWLVRLKMVVKLWMLQWDFEWVVVVVWNCGEWS